MNELSFDIVFNKRDVERIRKSGSTLGEAILKSAIDFSKKCKLVIDQTAILEAFALAKSENGLITFQASGILFQIQINA